MWPLITLVQIVLLLAAHNCEAATHWKPPTPAALQASISRCSAEAETRTGIVGISRPAQLVYCTASELGLWSDESGYNAKRIAKMFARHNQTLELLVVVEHCNAQGRQLTSPDRPAEWAYAAFRCATAGRIGDWLRAMQD